MKLAIAVGGALLTLCASLPLELQAHGAESHGQDKALFSGLETQAAKAVQQFHSALASGDAAAARALLADDVMIFEGKGVERSAEEYAKHHMLADIQFLASAPSKTLEHKVTVMGDTAISLARSENHGEYKGKQVDSESLETLVLRRTDAGWKIVHIHWSN
ncbi:DUF4440 domain-containing protein [Shewanella salipaludis]|uniref:Nuclear transport factor 2 family protein n=1 Tax=Shewanella salipaludis TaxID=2723052 RepID=A0A972G0N3_9GAMM|nr:DUF4440 domain-containing protein [Shewanella salipaludis]NMH65009.1 nuclear transport factor 2 family protein [Shewanella salipaludis]